MSLDVYLYRRDICPHCNKELRSNSVLFELNITHNLSKMAREAGIYYHVWRPKEIRITKAEELIEPLKKAIADMEARPDYYEQFNALNEWGLYKHFLPWLKEYLDACIKFPDANIEACR